MWRRPGQNACLRSKTFAAQRACKSTRKARRKSEISSLFESTSLPPLPQSSAPIIRLSEPSIPPHKRIATILISFATGFSVFFFLEDPQNVTPPPKQPSISPSQYIATRLTSTEVSGPDTKLLKIAAPPHLLPLKDSDDASIWSIFIKDDDIQVERAYTPLNGVDSNGDMLLWIKKYPKGEVGRWLHSKSNGENIEVRGPIKTWPWKDGMWDEVVMISGGTGITPFVQLFNRIICKIPSTSNTRFTLLHSSRVPAELPPSDIMEPMITFASANPEKFKLHVFVDELDGSKSNLPLEKINEGRITEAGLKRCLSGAEEQPKSWWKTSSKSSPNEEVKPRILFLVCGPDPMIGAIAGPYGRNFSQGPVGGLLAKMGYQSNEVYKL